MGDFFKKKIFCKVLMWFHYNNSLIKETNIYREVYSVKHKIIKEYLKATL